MKNDIRIYILLILSIICIPVAYMYIATGFVVQLSKKDFSTVLEFRKNKYIVTILLCITSGIVFSKYRIISTVFAVLMIMCVYTFFISIKYFQVIDNEKLKNILYLVTLIVFLIGLIQFINPKFVIPSKWVDFGEYNMKKRVFSTFYNPNIFGFYINIILIMVCSTFDFKKPNKLDIAVFILGLICLFLTFSRTSWISLTVALFIVGVLIDKKYIFFSGIILITLLSFDYISGIGRSDPLKVLEDSSTAYRMEIWKVCKDIILDYPITGIGFGTLFKYVPLYSNIVKDNIEHCHNMYIQIATELGIIGIVGYSHIIFGLLDRFLYRVKEIKEKRRWDTTIILFLMIMIHGMMDSVALTPQIMLILSMYGGNLVAKNRNEIANKSI